MDIFDHLMQWLAYPVGGGIFLNQLDELFMDANYLFRGLYRRSQRVVPAAKLRGVQQKRIAILLPAWKESDVIEQMIEHNLASIDYSTDNYDFFCGTYQNDPETQTCVGRLAQRYRNVHKVVVPHDGPTCKADCLNWVYQGVVLEEQRRDTRFDILLMHDAEDIIHPLALRLYCLLIPRYEFVQTPVFSLELNLSQIVAGTYVDEFAEHHLKDMKVRQAIGGLVPSAGVGSAFDRQAFEEIARSHGQQPFNTSSLTEDYEIGLKFRLANKRVCFACHTVEHEVLAPRGMVSKLRELTTLDGLRAAALKLREGGFGRRNAPRPTVERVKREEYIATREYFPAEFGTSVRQRSRWILGITLQAWEQTGWKGTLPVLYCMWRDRKGLLNNLLLVLAYAFFVYVLGRTAVAAAVGSSWRIADIVPAGGILYSVLALNLGALLWRGSMKLHLVRSLYGSAQGILSLPRLVVGNVISFAATTRAVRMYVRHRITGQPLRWLKTAHAFPSAEALRSRRRLLGELLVERHAVVASDLDIALSLQQQLDLPLGEVLALSGVLSERGVVPCLAEHFEMRAEYPDPFNISLPLLRKLPEIEAEEMNVLPLSGGEGAAAIVAVIDPLSLGHRRRLELRLDSRVEAVLSSKRAIQRARSVAYRRLAGLAPPGPLLGERLADLGALDRRAIPQLLEEQFETGEMLGELLLRKGIVDLAILNEALADEGGFVRVAMGDSDPKAIERLRYGYCALNSLVPLRQMRRGNRRVVASAYSVHPQAEVVLAERLGEVVQVVLAPRVEIRLALAKARRSAAYAGVYGGTDGAEALAILSTLRICLHPSELLSAARSAAASPLAYLEMDGEIDPHSAAAVRAEVFGVPLGSIAVGRVPRGLPPGITQKHAIRICQAGPGELVLAAPRPSAALARDIAYLLPGWRIAWQVTSHQIPNPQPRTRNDKAA